MLVAPETKLVCDQGDPFQGDCFDKNSVYYVHKLLIKRNHLLMERFSRSDCVSVKQPHESLLPLQRSNKNFRMYVIAQALKIAAGLCYTIRGRCFLLSVNYEKCPFLGVFSEVIQPCHLIWHYSKKFRILLFPSDFLPRSKWFPRTIRSWSPRSRSL